MLFLKNEGVVHYLKYGVIIVATLLFIIFSSEFVSRYAINWNQYEKVITSEIEAVFGNGNVTIGNIQGSLFAPKIIVYNTYIDYADDSAFKSHNITVIPQMEMHISILSLLMWKPTVKEVTIRSADIYPMHLKNIFSNSASISNVKKININEGTIALESNFFRDIKFAQLSLEASKKIAMEADIIVNDKRYKTKFNFNNKQVNFTLSSDLLKANFHGKNQQGQLSIEGNGIADSVNNFFKFIEFNDDIWDKFNASADVSWSSEDFKINSFSLESDSINAQGNFDLDYKTHFTNADISIEKIDLDRLLSSKKQSLELLQFLQKDLEGGRSSDASGKVKVNINEVYFNNDTINNISFISTINGRSTEINNFTLTMPGDTEVSIAGKILNNGVLSRFEGDFSLLSKDAQRVNSWLLPMQKMPMNKNLKIKYNFLITPQIVSLTDAQFSFDDVIAKLELYIKRDLKSKNIRGRIDINNLNLDNYRFVAEMMDSAYIYKISSDIDFDVEMENIRYESGLFNSITMKILSETGKLFLQDINVQSDKLKLKADIHLLNKGIEPLLNANIKADYIDSSIFNIPTILNIDQDPDKPQVEWLSKPISWMGLDKFNGSIVAQIKQLDTKMATFSNFKTNIKLRDKLFSINSFNTEVESGKIDLTANIGMESDSSILLSFSINNLKLNNIIKYIFNIDAITDGRFSCVGSIKSQGGSIDKLIKQASGKMEIAARGIKLKDFAVDLLFDKVLDVKTKSELANLTKVLIFSGGTDIEYFNGATNILNGMAATKLQFRTSLSTGVLSSNLSLLDFQNRSIMQFFFMNKRNNAEVLSTNMEISGPIWLPKLSFDSNKIYEMVMEKRVVNDQ